MQKTKKFYPRRARPLCGGAARSGKERKIKVST